MSGGGKPLAVTGRTFVVCSSVALLAARYFYLNTQVHRHTHTSTHVHTHTHKYTGTHVHRHTHTLTLQLPLVRRSRQSSVPVAHGSLCSRGAEAPEWVAGPSCSAGSPHLRSGPHSHRMQSCPPERQDPASSTRTQALVPSTRKPTQPTEPALATGGRHQKQRELQTCSLRKGDPKHSKLSKTRRQRNTQQMKEQRKNPPD